MPIDAMIDESPTSAYTLTGTNPLFRLEISNIFMKLYKDFRRPLYRDVIQSLRVMQLELHLLSWSVL